MRNAELRRVMENHFTCLKYRNRLSVICSRQMDDLRKRTKQFAIAIFELCDTLPNRSSCQIIRNQLMRAASSVGANYRAACHARSRAEFLSKMAIVEEEADETEYWLELLDELDVVSDSRLERFRNEAHEITSMVIASIKTARPSE